MRPAVLPALLALLFSLFCGWYGSGARPMSREEASDLLEAAGMDDAHDFVQRLFAQPDQGHSFLMVNFIALREKASYPNMPQLQPSWVRTGADADLHYSSIFLPAIAKRASHPVLVSNSVSRLPLLHPGPGPVTDQVWDYFALVRYRSRRDLVEVVGELTRQYGPRALKELKFAGVAKTFVIPVDLPAFSHAVRGLMALPFLLVLLAARRCGTKGATGVT
eukprot:g50396.t1